MVATWVKIIELSSFFLVLLIFCIGFFSVYAQIGFTSDCASIIILHACIYIDIFLIYLFFVNFFFIHSFVDPRTKPWLLSGSPGPLFTILGTYLYFCLYAGPKYMKDRKPFELKNTLIVYNIIQVVLSVVLVIEVSFKSQNVPNWFN